MTSKIGGGSCGTSNTEGTSNWPSYREAKNCMQLWRMSLERLVHRSIDTVYRNGRTAGSASPAENEAYLLLSVER